MWLRTLKGLGVEVGRLKRKEGLDGAGGGVEDGGTGGGAKEVVEVGGSGGAWRERSLDMGAGVKPNRRASRLASLRVRPNLKRRDATSASNL